MITGGFSENFDLRLEEELFNNSNSYLTEIVMDTGFTGLITEGSIAIPDNICTDLKLIKSKETVEIWNPLGKKPVKCYTTNLGVGLNENNVHKTPIYDVEAIILPSLYDKEVLIGPDFLTKILGCRMMIIDYERNNFKLVIK